MGLEPTPSCEDRILSPARLPFRHFGLIAQFSIVERIMAVNPGLRPAAIEARFASIEGSPRLIQPFISSSSLVTVRQFLPVLVVASFESK